jgi:site-specific DNA-methyltransferase (adenine-specific)
MEAAATWEPIDSLTPWDKNPRRNDGAVEQVAHSITRFGFGAPIIARASDRVIIGGHTRYKAAQRLGLDKVPVRFLDLDPAEAAALALADNKLGELAEWDDAGVAAILAELEAQGAPIDGLGWDDEELKALVGATVDGLDADPFANLPDCAPEFRSMTFTLTHEQYQDVEAALRAATDAGPYIDTGNENRNGNALARIAEAYRG